PQYAIAHANSQLADPPGTTTELPGKYSLEGHQGGIWGTLRIRAGMTWTGEFLARTFLGSLVTPEADPQVVRFLVFMSTRRRTSTISVPCLKISSSRNWRCTPNLPAAAGSSSRTASWACCSHATISAECGSTDAQSGAVRRSSAIFDGTEHHP